MNSTNIKVMSEEIQHLKNEVHNLDVEIPAHPSTDEGKYLGVASDGSLAWSKVPDELPATTEASAGQILALDSNKAPIWLDNYNLNISTIETDTGYTIGGEKVYSKRYTGTLTTQGSDVLDSDINLVNAIGVIKTSEYIHFINNYISSAMNSRVFESITSSNVSIAYGASFASCEYDIVLFYTKPTSSALTSPTPETRETDPEEEPVVMTKTTRKKSTK